ncbi:MAG TPA: four helix bundle protein [Chromatiales bacterium]|nr:four helix bundle protein [Chromatiales bacterium]
MPQFEELDVWRRACRLSVALYKQFADCREYAFKDQVTRSGLSVASNIAEGFERESRAELNRFLRISKGSCGELRTQLFIGVEVGLVPRSEGLKLVDEALQISKMLSGLIKHQQKITCSLFCLCSSFSSFILSLWFYWEIVQR